MKEIRNQNCVIADSVSIGEGTMLGNFIFIRDNTIIGDHCIIGSYVDIEGDVTIGRMFQFRADAISPGV